MANSNNRHSNGGERDMNTNRTDNIPLFPTTCQISPDDKKQAAKRRSNH